MPARKVTALSGQPAQAATQASAGQLGDDTLGTVCSIGLFGIPRMAVAEPKLACCVPWPLDVICASRPDLDLQCSPNAP